MVEVDVREHEVTQVLEREAVARKLGFERLQAGRRTAVDEGRLRTRKQVRGDDPGPAEMEKVEELEAI
jgi:hypothetical protein